MKILTVENELLHGLEGRPAFVPTMGALHEGHLSLVRHAAESFGNVVVSIFVNPTQFAPSEDLESYPRSPEHDLALLEQAGANAVFMPTVESIYPNGVDHAHAEARDLELPAVATKPALEDAHRPHFFGGVCLVVGRLFDLVRPGKAVFGEKDYQQLLVIGGMVQEDESRFEGIEVIGRPTVREDDGLAMSSRNAYLPDALRDRALGLRRALQAAQESPDTMHAESAMQAVLEEHQLEIDYAVVRDAETLEPVEDSSRARRALIAARLEHVRLIDNAPLSP